MATIDSLDLASLTNNPQSIAEALEDVLEVSSGNIASLKATAQTDQELITNTLKPQAQADADTLSDLVDDAPTADILNLDLSVTDITSDFTKSFTGNIYNEQLYKFNGFVFVTMEIQFSPAVSVDTKVGEITNSTYYPASETKFPAIGLYADNARHIVFKTDGDIIASDPDNPSGSTLYVTINGFYRYE
jgi:hypothetical protein